MPLSVTDRRMIPSASSEPRYLKATDDTPRSVSREVTSFLRRSLCGDLAVHLVYFNHLLIFIYSIIYIYFQLEISNYHSLLGHFLAIHFCNPQKNTTHVDR